MPHRRGRARALLIAAAAFAAACGSAPEAPVAQPVDAAEARVLFGDDRIADVLAKDLGQVPTSVAAFERTFHVGRGCARADSKEIYVVEEVSSRFGGVQKRLPRLAPRLAITGCDDDATKPEGERRQAGVMVAVVSSEEASGWAEGDTLVTGPKVEAMALDRTTGLFSFYVLGEAGGVQRLELGGDGRVHQHTKLPGKPLESVTLAPDDARCFHCHVQGAPIMNELADPWTAWVSRRRETVASTGLRGETAALVAEASGAASRASYAGGLEVVVRWAVNELAPAHVAAVLEGRRGGGVAGLLRSVLCETQLQYLSNNGDTVPIETLIDPAVFDGESFARPRAVAGSVGPVHVPVRSEMDKAVERELVRRGFLTHELALAARLIDPDSDVFSDARCRVLGALEGTVGAAADPTPAPESVLAHVREALAAAIRAIPLGPRRTYLETLVATSPTRPTTEARNAWLDEARATLAARAARLATDEGRRAADDATRARQAAATKLFPRAENPLPVFDVPPPR